MPYLLCPLCGQSGRLLDVTKGNPFGSSVDYYRCDPCGHVWLHSNLDPNAPVVNVTKQKGETPQPEQ
jgi:uncharacterized Zn finger protein